MAGLFLPIQFFPSNLNENLVLARKSIKVNLTNDKKFYSHFYTAETLVLCSNNFRSEFCKKLSFVIVIKLFLIADKFYEISLKFKDIGMNPKFLLPWLVGFVVRALDSEI